MIKKILYKLLFIIIITNLFSYNSFAEGTCESGCKIKDATPEIITEYISNNRKIIKNLSKNLGNKTQQYNIPTSGNIGGNDKSIFDLNSNDNIGYANKTSSVSTGIGLRIYNTLFNWNETTSGFKYFLANIDGDVPSAISRDLRLIDNQNRSLNYFLSRVIKSGQFMNDVEPKKACEGIEDNLKCEKLIGNNIEIAIKNLIQNNNTINLILRKELGFMGFNSIVGSSSYDELFAIPENFKQEVKNNYNKQTYKSCAECKGGSIDRIKKSIEKITLNDRAGKEGIDEWENAWNLLLGIKDDKNKKNDILERNLLAEELSKQGISSNNSDAVLNDLKENQGNDFGMSIGNNPITNSFENLVEAISRPFKSRQVTLLSESLAQINDALPDKDTFSFDEIKYSEINLTDDGIIADRIKKIVAINKSIITKQNKNTDKLQGRIIQLHINLTQTINTLEKIIPKTEKICNDQDSGNGKCSYRN